MDAANFLIIIPLLGCALVGLTALVSIMLNHQRKMAELIRERHVDSTREQVLQQELAALRQEVRQLRATAHQPSHEVSA